ncbi:hypothetical protein NW762_014451 [Fusarium torreyae]|uniref:Uncharacterized protein n=1 Tax=Fusarium torreyae TaxID=1237075 RepID=A0A9W8RMC3_9HYPO|nr:hypothetical protein NW762_014451 [Fusarium torreyae]
MKIPAIISYYILYGWRVIKVVFLLTLPISAFTVLLAFIQGLILGPWYQGTQINHLHLFVANMVHVKTMEWFREPGGANPLYVSRAPYHIRQLHNPLEWTRDVGISRPSDWNTDNVGVLSSFGDLYRRRRRYSDDPSWHNWIYLSANEQPLNETWNQDPWDKAFLELLEYRDMYEPLGRGNFHYITCPKNFLCDIWRISGPALVHLTNEPIKRNATQERSRRPILDPVSVRVFEFPLNEPVIRGTFPTYFEQMRSITASNSTYWTTRMKYSHFDQVQGQALKVLKGVKDKHPWTYGILAKAEEKWINLWAAEESALILLSRVISLAIGATPTYFGSQVWERVKTRWMKRKQNHSEGENISPRANDPAAVDPVAYQLQNFLNSLTEEDKEKFGKTYRGGVLLDRIQNGLDKRDWDTKDDVLRAVEDALRV